jgi:TerC family integral membrane protein
MNSIAGPPAWIVFGLVVLVMLVLDLGVFHRKAHVVRFREAAIWSAVWVGLALSFNLLVLVRFGVERGLEFFQAWLVEKALSVDNIFVFLAIFAYFSVSPRVQHRILFWGIFGALITRGAFIWVGASLLQSFHFVLYIFGVFLILTAGRMLVGDEAEVNPDNNPVLRLFRRFVPLATDYDGTAFIVRRDGRWMATPLLLVLVVVEATDVVFAVDSIPAVFGITQDVFIVYTSNIFAILGLRAMSFMVASVILELRYLKTGLSLVLAFVGVKMLIESYVHVPELLSLAVVVTLLVGASVLSLLHPEPKGEKRKEKEKKREKEKQIENHAAHGTD